LRLNPKEGSVAMELIICNGKVDEDCVRHWSGGPVYLIPNRVVTLSWQTSSEIDLPALTSGAVRWKQWDGKWIVHVQ
jgi:hypothetical protein